MKIIRLSLLLLLIICSNICLVAQKTQVEFSLKFGTGFYSDAGYWDSFENDLYIFKTGASYKFNCKANLSLRVGLFVCYYIQNLKTSNNYGPGSYAYDVNEIIKTETNRQRTLNSLFIPVSFSHVIKFVEYGVGFQLGYNLSLGSDRVFSETNINGEILQDQYNEVVQDNYRYPVEVFGSVSFRINKNLSIPIIYYINLSKSNFSSAIPLNEINIGLNYLIE